MISTQNHLARFYKQVHVTCCGTIVSGILYTHSGLSRSSGALVVEPEGALELEPEVSVLE